jgi:hypothetical protein
MSTEPINFMKVMAGKVQDISVVAIDSMPASAVHF